MVAPAADRLTKALDDYLAAATATLSNPPARRYVAHGEPIVDCEQLVAWPTGMRSSTVAQPGDLPAQRRTPRVRLVTLAVDLHRPVCAGANPSAAQLDADGHSLATDGWALFAGLLHAHQSSPPTLFPSLGDLLPSSGLVTAAEVSGGEGRFAGWRILMDVAL